MAGGLIYGNITLSTPDNGPAGYTMRLDLRGADVQALTGESAKLHGEITATLAITGPWNEPERRIGRGELVVQGRELYRLPVVFGWLQIANLQLPTQEPFTEATIRYSFRGQKKSQIVVLEMIELRAGKTVVKGSGTIDFANGAVHLVLAPTDPRWANVPVANFVEIHVDGEIKAPKVEGKVMNVFDMSIKRAFAGPPDHKDKDKDKQR